MATLSPVRLKQRKTVFVILAGCDSCGQIHPVEFSDKGEFMQLRCRHTHAPIYATQKSKVKVWREFQNDLMAGAVAC